MSSSGHPDARARLRRLGPVSTLARCDRRERVWILRRLWYEWRESPRCHGPILLGLPVLALGLMSSVMPDHTVPAPGLVAVICWLSGGVLVALGGVAAWRLMRHETPELLLRLDRCACCGHGSNRRGEVGVAATPRSCRGWRCSECGTFWPGAATSIPEFEFRNAA